MAKQIRILRKKKEWEKIVQKRVYWLIIYLRAWNERKKKMCPAMTLIFECPLSLVARGELSQEQFWSLTSTAREEGK